MSEQNPTHDETIACTTCQLEVPETAAHTFEGEDYVQHFCGLDCMVTWKKEQGLPESDEEHTH